MGIFHYKLFMYRKALSKLKSTQKGAAVCNGEGGLGASTRKKRGGQSPRGAVASVPLGFQGLISSELSLTVLSCLHGY